MEDTVYYVAGWVTSQGTLCLRRAYSELRLALADMELQQIENPTLKYSVYRLTPNE